jgi:hypothetical protein
MSTSFAGLTRLSLPTGAPVACIPRRYRSSESKPMPTTRQRVCEILNRHCSPVLITNGDR